MATPGAGLFLEIQRVLPAPARQVFRAFLSPIDFTKWWGPDGFSIPSLDFEPMPANLYRIEMKPPEGDSFYLAGEFRAVDPPTRLAMTFLWEDPDPDDVETLAELSFRDLGESTEICLTQGRFKTEARRDLHRDGWMEALDKLERLLSEA